MKYKFRKKIFKNLWHTNSFFKPTFLKIITASTATFYADLLFTKAIAHMMFCLDCPVSFLSAIWTIFFIWPMDIFLYLNVASYIASFLYFYVLVCLIIRILNKIIKQESTLKKINKIFSIIFLFIFLSMIAIHNYQIYDYNKKKIPAVRDAKPIKTNTILSSPNLECEEIITDYKIIRELSFSPKNELAYHVIDKDEEFFVFQKKEIGYNFGSVYGIDFDNGQMQGFATGGGIYRWHYGEERKESVDWDLMDRWREKRNKMRKKFTIEKKDELNIFYFDNEEITDNYLIKDSDDLFFSDDATKMAFIVRMKNEYNPTIIILCDILKNYDNF